MSGLSNHRRKKVNDPTRHHSRPTESDRPPQIPSSAYVTAYEAQLIYGRDDLADRITRRDRFAEGGDGESGSGPSRGALIRWEGEHDGTEEIWLDRYDILHLLPSLPRLPSPPQSPAGTSSSWDDLPSDLEDSFFLSGDEDIEVYEREKKRKWMEALREDRLRKREKEELASKDEDLAMGKGKTIARSEDDEQPSEAILTLMSHTATSLSTSPNPRLLEMRIMTHHAKDERFDFLRGRYKDTWVRLKNEAQRGRARPKEEKVMGALVGGYESNNEDDDEDVQKVPPPPPPPDDEVPPEPVDDEMQVTPAMDESEKERLAGPEADEEEKKKLRRQRAEEWKRKRAKVKELGQNT